MTVNIADMEKDGTYSIKGVSPKVAQYPNLFEIPSSTLWPNFISIKHTILIKIELLV